MVAPPALRIVFFGTPDFAVPSLQALLDSRHHVVAAVTQPDRPRGRGQKPQPSSIKAVAVRADLPVHQPERLRDDHFVAALDAMNADLGVVAAYGKILTDAVLATPRLGMINVHASLLPKYRGAAPIQRAVMAGEVETGITIMRVVKALDAGPMISQTVRGIAEDDTSDVVERDLAQIGAGALVDAVNALAEGRATEIPQDESLATYAPKIDKRDGTIDWSRAARVIHNQIRGLHPWPHAYTSFDGERLILLRSTVDPSGGSASALPGTILEAHGERLSIATGVGALRITELQRAGRNPVSAREFLAARPLPPGARFSPPRP